MTFSGHSKLSFPSQIKVGEGLATGEYMTAVRLFSENRSISDAQQQSARTCAAAGEHSSQNIRKVNWNEMFFFKVKSEVCELSTILNICAPCPLDIHDSCSTVVSRNFFNSHVFILLTFRFHPKCFRRVIFWSFLCLMLVEVRCFSAKQ